LKGTVTSRAKGEFESHVKIQRVAKASNTLFNILELFLW